MEVVDHPPSLLIPSNLGHLRGQQQKQQQQQQPPLSLSQQSPSSHRTTMKIGDGSLQLNPDLKRCFDELVSGCKPAATETAEVQEKSHFDAMKQWEFTLNNNNNNDRSTINSSISSNSDDDDDSKDDDDEADDAVSSSDVDSVTDEQENRLVKHLVQAAFSRRLSQAQLSHILAAGPARKRARLEQSSSSLPLLPASRRRTSQLGVSESAPCLRTKDAEAGTRTAGSDPMTSSSTAASASAAGAAVPSPTVEVLHPKFVLQARLQDAGRGTPQYHPALTLSTTASFFHQATPKDLVDYDMQVVQAVRSENVNALRHMHAAGRSMNCANAFGETILHIAARRGAVSVVQFLVNEARVNVRVCCDFGRTPLHDACWTPQANLAVVQILLAACPDLLYITDKRGHAPLQYIHRENWAEWNRFLRAQSIDRLTPKELLVVASETK